MSKSDRNLTVARMPDEHIDGVEVHGDAFGELLSELGIAPKIERSVVVTSAKAGDETRAYIVNVHELPASEGSQRVYACTCPAFKFQELPYAGDIEDDVEAGLAAIGTCKHGKKVRVRDRRTECRDDGQGSFDVFEPGTD